MGKSPGKWIKSILLGRKSSKSKLSKGNYVSKSAGNQEILVSSKVPVPDTIVDHSTISQPSPAVVATSGVDSDHVTATKLPNEGFTFSCAQGDENAAAVTNLGSQEDPERIRHEMAAVRAQAALRGYLARRAFRTLKGIIRLQGLIRGHLVRRQAVATLFSVRAIVKLQAIARGQKVRRSATGIEVQNTCDLGKIQGAICSSGICTFTRSEKLIKNVFAEKLLASSPGAIPLSPQYSPEHPNSSLEWLQRWTISRFWESHSQAKKNAEHDTTPKVEIEQGRQKRSARKLSRGYIENSSGHSKKVSEKPNRNPRKFSSHPINSAQEHLQNGFEKVNRNLRKTFDPAREVRERFDVDNGKSKCSVRKSSTVTAPEVPEGTNDVAVVAKISDVDGSPKLPAGDNHASALQERCDLDFQPSGNNSQVEDIQGTIKQLYPEDHDTGNENQKISDRTSFPPNIENRENVVRNTPQVPSYMAPTESARAKLRGQGSPRFYQDAIENSGTTRRHSLPSSIDDKLTPMSPRVPELVHAASKGGTRSDRSLSASREGTVSDKAIKAEWRR